MPVGLHGMLAEDAKYDAAPARKVRRDGEVPRG